MKLGIYLITIFALTTCKTIKLEKESPFTVTGATYNNWVGGQQGVSGIRVIIGYTTTEKVDFKSIFFNDKEAKIEMKEREGKTYLFGYIDTSTRKDDDLILDIDPKKETKNKLPQKLPFKLKENEAIVSYLDGKRMKFVKVSDLKRTATDFYP